MASSSDILYAGLIHGRLPGQKKDWVLFYLTVSTTQLHIFEGHEDFSQPRKHMRSLGIGSDDMIGEEKGKKKEYKFYVQRADGKYIFKCDTPEQRENWIVQLQRLVNRKEFESMQGFTPPTAEEFDPSKVGTSAAVPKRYDVPRPPTTPPAQKNKTSTLQSRGKSFSAKNQPLPPIPPLHDQAGRGFNSRVSVASDDSGIGASNEGEVRRNKSRAGSSSLPASGDGTFLRPTGPLSPKSQSDGGRFNVRQVVQVEEEGNPEELENYKWFWGHMNRKDCEEQLRAEGNIGNFVIRVNATGNYIMSFWRSDGIHHHKISQYGNMFRFERTTVSADGCSLVDLLDTYMKNCTDRTIKPFGGQLFLQYDEPWNPPPLDMEKLGQRLREQRERKEPQRSPKPPLKPGGQENASRQPRPKDRYDLVEDMRKPKKRPPPSNDQVPPSEPSARHGSGQEEQQPALGGMKKLPKQPPKDKPVVAQPLQPPLKKVDSAGKFKALPPTPPAKEQTRRASVEEDTSQRPAWALPGASEIRRNTQQNLPKPSPKPPTAKKPPKTTPVTKPKPTNRGAVLPERLAPVEQPQQAPSSPEYANLSAVVNRSKTLSPPKSPPYENAEVWAGTPPTQPSPKSRSLGRSVQSISRGAGPNSAASPPDQGTNGEPLNFSEGIYQNVNAPPPPRRRKN